MLQHACVIFGRSLPCYVDWPRHVAQQTLSWFLITNNSSSVILFHIFFFHWNCQLRRAALLYAYYASIAHYCSTNINHWTRALIQNSKKKVHFQKDPPPKFGAPKCLCWSATVRDGWMVPRSRYISTLVVVPMSSTRLRSFPTVSYHPPKPQRASLRSMLKEVESCHCVQKRWY